jgi:FkbM family methyltransferase
MIEKLLQRLAPLKFIETMSGWLNRLPLPYRYLPVKVGRHRLVAHTLDRYLALWLWKFGLLEAAEAKLLAQFCQPGMGVVDIGANIGFHTLLLAQLVGPTGHVWAFEPDADNFATLSQNVRDNHYTQVSVIQNAVSSTSGQGYLYISAGHSGDHRLYQAGQRSSRPTPITALDDFFAPGQRVDLIKMDIQGAEGLALMGMRRLLKDNPQVIIFMEFWPLGLRQAGSNPEQLLADLQDFGFMLERINEYTGTPERVSAPLQLVVSLTSGQHTNLLIRPMER